MSLVELPPPGYPLVTSVISSPMFPLITQKPDGTPDVRPNLEPIAWVLSRPHPFVPEAQIVRMFADDNGVEVYSHDGKNGIRDRIPISMIRLIEEGMPLEQFIEEIAEAEADDDDDDDLLPNDEPFEPENEPSHGESSAPMPATPNGQAAS